MKEKRLILPHRERQLPDKWSWIDHRLVREDYLSRGDAHAWTLYLFLLTVSDSQGLSYYSQSSIARRLSCSPGQVQAARRQLVQIDLIAYAKPFYQVLEFPAAESPTLDSVRMNQGASFGEILRRAIEQDEQPGGSR